MLYMIFIIRRLNITEEPHRILVIQFLTADSVWICC